MDFTPSIEQRLVLEAVSGLAEQVSPKAAEWDESDAVEADAKASVAELGLLGVFLDEERGGAGFGVATGLLAIEALARGSGALALATAAHAAGALPVLAAAGASADLINSLAAGERWAALATGLQREGGRLVGTARWVVGASTADLLVALTTEGEAFVFEDSAGWSVERAESLGMRGAGLGHVSMEEVDAGSPLGRVDVPSHLPLIRATWAAVGSGVGKAALAEARAYALDRKQFGRPIADFQAIQWMLADAATELDAAALLCLRAGLLMDAGEDASEAAISAFVLVSESALSAAQKAIQIHGGYGFVKEFPVERLARDARYFGVALGGRDALRRDLGSALLTRT